MEFNQLRNTLVALFKENPDIDRDGLRKLARTKDVSSVIALVKEYWHRLNTRSWEQFQQALLTYYKPYEKDFAAQGIYYNTPSTIGLVCVDDNAESDCIVIRGNAECVAHGKIHILLCDHASATLLDTVQCTARDQACVVSRQWSRVSAKDNALVKAFDKSQVTSNGETTICLYGCSSAIVFKAGKVDAGVNAKIVYKKKELDNEDEL